MSLTFEAWLALVDKGQTPAALVRKDYSTDSIVAVPPSDAGVDSRRLKFTVSTGTVDRERDVIAQSGWMLDNFKKNPVVLFGHDYSGLPVAKATDIQVVGDTLVAEAEFATAEMYPFAETVYQMVKGGFLNATSVGFRPLKWVRNEERKGYDIESAELFEFSIVPVPANPDALVMARSAGIDVEPLAEWARKTLTTVSGDGVWLSKAVAGKVQAIAEAVSQLSADQPVGDLLADDVLTKKGRVLSAKNEADLRQCMTLLENVLAQLDPTTVDEPVAASLDPILTAAVEPDPVPEPTGVMLVDPPIAVSVDPPAPLFDPDELSKFISTRVRKAMVPVVMDLTGRLPD
jgi:HK97 family phage prohead protease